MVASDSTDLEPIDGPEVFSQKLISAAKARKFVSQNSRGYLAVSIQDPQGNPVDPAPDTLTLKVWFNDLSGVYGPEADSRGTLVINATTDTGIVRDEAGKYHYDVGPALTAQRGLLSAEWGYEVDSMDFKFQDDMQIQEQMPYYDAMREESKLLVEQASWFFADLFDSTTGGPWLQENFQTHFDYNRIAFLMNQGVMKFNMTGYPVTSYGVGVDEQKVPKNFHGIVLWATKLEAIRHLIVSYTEQPNVVGLDTTFTDRRDYADRWRAVLEDEKDDLKQAIKMAKRSLLNLGRGSLLVSGGIYGGGAKGFYMPGIYAAQTRSFRFYPAAPAVSWGNIGRGGV